jgi:hypothetical protein
MTVEPLLENLRKRVPWTVMREMLQQCELRVSRGWDKTIQHLVTESNKKNDLVSNFERLRALYCNHLLVGEKAVKFFQVEKQKITDLVLLFQTYQPEETPFHRIYPFALPEEQLEEINDSSPKLVEIKDSEHNLVLVFCANRLFTKRIEIDPERLTEENKKGSYAGVFATERFSRQIFDIIVLWKDTGLVEVRVDNIEEITSQERANSFIQVITKFNSLMKELLKDGTFLQEPVNFFPLIKNLYDDFNEGKVCELGFTTDGGSIKHERMRRGGLDLRTEAYHKAGREAVDHITPYRLAIVWKFLSDSSGMQSQPELLLPGNAKDLNRTKQNLDEVIINKCTGLEDYYFLFEKLSKFAFVQLGLNALNLEKDSLVDDVPL